MKSLILNRVAFSIFGLEVYWYGLIITSAIVLDLILLIMLVKKFNYDSDMPYDLIIFVVAFGIVGARLFSVLFDEDASILDFFKFREGGMSIIGALCFGAIGIFIYTKIKNKSFFYVSDLLVPLVLLAQGIGRWGNYFNGEVYGQLITNEKFMWFPIAVMINGNWYQALFFYESILDILGSVILIVLLFKKRENMGLVTGSYLLYYGIVRFFLEGLRQNKYILKLGTLPISRVLSAVMAIVGIVIIVCVCRKKSNKDIKGGTNVK